MSTTPKLEEAPFFIILFLPGVFKDASTFTVYSNGSLMYAAIHYILKRGGHSQPDHSLLLLFDDEDDDYDLSGEDGDKPKERNRQNTSRNQGQVYFVLYLTFEQQQRRNIDVASLARA